MNNSKRFTKPSPPRKEKVCSVFPLFPSPLTFLEVFKDLMELKALKFRPKEEEAISQALTGIFSYIIVLLLLLHPHFVGRKSTHIISFDAKHHKFAMRYPSLFRLLFFTSFKTFQIINWYDANFWGSVY